LLLSLIQYAVLILAARLSFSLVSFLVFGTAAFVIKLIQLASDRNSADGLAKTISKIFFMLLLITAGSWLILLYSGMHSPYTLMATLGSLATATFISSVIFLTAQFNQQLTAELQKEKARLRASLSRVRQRQWFSRRRVVSQVHGDVQGAVVAAITRLSRQSDPKQLELARTDLDRAMEALRDLPELSGDFETELASLKRSWEGVCQIDFSLSKAARDLIGLANTNAFVVNAMVTEAVVNAVRNGSATVVQISVSCLRPGTLSLEIRDNGQIRQPVAIAGGARELLALTTKFSAQREGDFTVATAEIPLTDILPAD
jgi:hypothetical protein